MSFVALPLFILAVVTLIVFLILAHRQWRFRQRAVAVAAYVERYETRRHTRDDGTGNFSTTMNVYAIVIFTDTNGHYHNHETWDTWHGPQLSPYSTITVYYDPKKPSWVQLRVFTTHELLCLLAVAIFLPTIPTVIGTCLIIVNG
jgi:hypothetical protein